MKLLIILSLLLLSGCAGIVLEPPPIYYTQPNYPEYYPRYNRPYNSVIQYNKVWSNSSLNLTIY